MQYKTIKPRLAISFLQFFIILLCCLATNELFGQSFIPSGQMGGTNNDLITSPGVNNVGLGKFLNYPNPLDRLSIGGHLSLATTNPDDELTIMRRSDRGGVSIFSNTDETNGSGIRLWGSFAASKAGSIHFFSTYTSHSGFNDRAFDFKHLDYATQTSRSSLVINDAGNVRIGNGAPAPINSRARLTVDGDIRLNDNGNADRFVYNDNDFGSLSLYMGTNFGPSIMLNGVNHYNYAGQILFNSNSNPGLLGFLFTRTSTSGIANTNLMGLENSGHLHLHHSITFDYEPSNVVNRQINGHAPFTLFMINSGDNLTDGPSIRLCGRNYNSQGANTPGEIHFVSYGTTGPGVRFYSYNPAGQGTYKEAMTVQKDGKVVIGDYPNLTTPGNYLLYVQTGILTEHVKVAIKSTVEWSDYVFDDNYKLKPLKEVETYIEENKHLPDVPSANEVVAKGVDLGEMNAKLLQKIEELTLYSIQQQKLLEKQGQQLAKQEQELNSLKSVVGIAK